MIKVEASFDDGSIYDLRVMKLIEPYEIPTTFYIPVNWAKVLAKKGIEALPIEAIDVINDSPLWEIGSHGVDHLLLTRYPIVQQRLEIEGSLDYWEARDIKVNKFAYPRGYFNQDIKDLVKEAGYKSARTVAVGELVPPRDSFACGTTVHVGLDRKEYGSDWLHFASIKMEEAIRRGKDEDIIYHFWGHSEEINRLNQWSNFESFLSMINENLL